MAEKVRVVEVGPRDGLQNEPNIKSLPEGELVAARVGFITALADAGYTDIEAGAFVRADKVPQMVATDKVILALQKTRPDLWRKKRFWTLVPNRRGLETALAVGAKHIAFFTATSETFNRANINMGVKESLKEINTVITEALRAKIMVRGYISTVWGCPYEGKTSPKAALRIAEKMLSMGVSEVSLGDTIGVATPHDVRNVLSLFRKKWPLAGHFHDTRGTALANCLEALNWGIRVLDASAGGLGGCPYAKGATGNVASEDLLYMLRGLKFTSGVDIDKVCRAGESLSQKLGTPLPSRFHRAWLAAQKEA